jgi:hypothetical protein
MAISLSQLKTTKHRVSGKVSAIGGHLRKVPKGASHFLNWLEVGLHHGIQAAVSPIQKTTSSEFGGFANQRLACLGAPIERCTLRPADQGPRETQGHRVDAPRWGAGR